MIRISVTIEGRMADAAPTIRAALRDVVAARTEAAYDAVIAAMAAPKSGRTYRRPDGSPYTASAPGEAPAVRTGELRDSYQWAMLDDLTGAVWSDDPKAPWLEFGTGAVAARPALVPAVDAQRQPLAADLADLGRRLT